MTTLQDIATAQTEYDKASNARVTAQSFEYEKLEALNALKDAYAKEQASITGLHVALVNEVGLTASIMQTYVAGLNSHGKKVAEKYALASPIVGESPKPVGATILLTERLPIGLVVPPGQTRAQAYRVVENGIPMVYASVRGSSKPFGRYRKPWVLGGIVKSPAIIASGTITVLAHELSELLVAPYLDQFTLPDSAGKSWRKEVCDPVLGAYYFENINGQDCVFPDFVLPSFWDANGKAPFSYLGSKVGPMVWAVGSYAWFKSAVVRLMRVKF